IDRHRCSIEEEGACNIKQNTSRSRNLHTGNRLTHEAVKPSVLPMGLVKVTIFQKLLSDGLNLATFKKLAAVKSDFLLLPEYFFAYGSVKDPRDLKEKTRFALDWLIKLNGSYRGVIIGGSVVLEENGHLYNATPVISGGQIVDWYRKRHLTENEKKFLTPGND